MTAESQEKMIGTGVEGRVAGPSSGPVTMVPIISLSVIGSPRSGGEDPEHVRSLAEVEGEVPPILVHRRTMRVIDGAHRLAAARLAGRDRIAVRFFDGDEADAFVLAVQSNTRHGMPLSLADRKSAAGRILRSHPWWSDRSIAAVTGVSAGTVAELRSAGPAESGAIRIGRDGRARPVNGAEGRRRAAEFIAKNPGVSLRQIAKEASISPETARDVRRRLELGVGPVAVRRKRTRTGPDSREAIKQLWSDPEFGQTDAGRLLLGLLESHAVAAEERARLSQSVPSRWAELVATLAFECGKVWDEFAQRVEHE